MREGLEYKMIFTNQQKKDEENPKIQDSSKGRETKCLYKEITLPSDSLVSIIQIQNVQGQLGNQVNRSGWAEDRTGHTHTLAMPSKHWP